MLSPSIDDRLAIADLHARYCWAVDTGDSDGCRACFRDDAQIYEVQPDGSVLHATPHEFYGRYHAQERVVGHQHHQTNTRFEPDPEGRPDHWRVWSYALATHAERNDPTTPSHPAARTVWCGYVADIIGKSDQGWLIVERAIAPWTGEVVDIRQLVR